MVQEGGNRLQKKVDKANRAVEGGLEQPAVRWGAAQIGGESVGEETSAHLRPRTKGRGGSGESDPCKEGKVRAREVAE